MAPGLLDSQAESTLLSLLTHPNEFFKLLENYFKLLEKLKSKNGTQNTRWCIITPVVKYSFYFICMFSLGLSLSVCPCPTFESLEHNVHTSWPFRPKYFNVYFLRIRISFCKTTVLLWSSVSLLSQCSMNWPELMGTPLILVWPVPLLTELQEWKNQFHLDFRFGSLRVPQNL